MSTNKTAPTKAGGHRFFTVDEANATLPLVRLIVSDLVGLARDIGERRGRLAFLLAGHEADTARRRDDPYREELAQVEKEVEKDCRRLEGFVAELRELGIEPTRSSEGLVDFPARIEGREVFLSWKLGEPPVVYWHEGGAGSRTRKRLGCKNRQIA
jgi:hypothetical protein